MGAAMQGMFALLAGGTAGLCEAVMGCTNEMRTEKPHAAHHPLLVFSLVLVRADWPSPFCSRPSLQVLFEGPRSDMKGASDGDEQGEGYDGLRGPAAEARRQRLLEEGVEAEVCQSEQDWRGLQLAAR